MVTSLNLKNNTFKSSRGINSTICLYKTRDLCNGVNLVSICRNVSENISNKAVVIISATPEIPLLVMQNISWSPPKTYLKACVIHI